MQTNSLPPPRLHHLESRPKTAGLTFERMLVKGDPIPPVEHPKNYEQKNIAWTLICGTFGIITQ